MKYCTDVEIYSNYTIDKKTVDIYPVENGYIINFTDDGFVFVQPYDEDNFDDMYKAIERAFYNNLEYFNKEQSAIIHIKNLY